MISVYVPCQSCSACGGSWAPSTWGREWLRCRACDGIGRVWAPGAPGYDCPTKLSATTPGEIVTLGNGDHGRVLWHMPRRTKKVTPETTFLGMIEPFTEVESYAPIGYPSCVGVASVDLSRSTSDGDVHANSRTIDYSDPVHRQVAGRLI